ncbi:MAG: serine hydrolase [Actinomycetia bacterium]|nr:serine hydrolase [Actinomycetes bacterium]MCP5030607.1 serine hydrolase [Actinomycetes bacterium]
METCKWLATACVLALVVAACADSTTTAPPTTAVTTTALSPTDPVVRPTDEWPVSTPEDQGMDSGMLADMVNWAASQAGIDSVMVVRNGHVVLDAVVYPFGYDDPHIIHSCTKSVIATLIGIAIDQGLLAGVEVPVVEILGDAVPETVDDRKAAMAVEDLLTMSTGLDCRDSYLYDWKGMAEMQQSEDWTAHVLALPMRDEPGTRFEYCNGSSFLLSAILSEVTGMSASEYAEQVLFGPLGFGGFEWPANSDGITMGWGELRLHPADMAKLGYLYLRTGEWDGTELVPAAWVEAATAEHIPAGTLSDGYGYQWWIAEEGYAMALGYGGQYIFVMPDHDLVMVVTSGLPGGRFGVPQDLATRYVIPAAVSDTPLPEDPDAQGRLAAAVAAAATPPEPEPVALPELHSTLGTSRYEFHAPELGDMSFGLRFESDAAFLRLEVDSAARSSSRSQATPQK